MERKNFADRLSGSFAAENFLPLLFCTLIMSAIFYVYTQTYVNIYLVLSAVISVGLFFCYEYIMKRKKTGILIYILLMIIVIILLAAVSGTMKDGILFVEWFMTGGETVETRASYMFLLMIGFTFFISSVVFYFTHAVFRAAVLILSCLIPCAIFVKAAASIPLIYPILFGAAVTGLYIINKRRLLSKRVQTEGKGQALTAYVDFAVAAVLLAAIIPKPSVTPFYEKFEAFTSAYSLMGRNTKMSGKYTKYSGNADDFLNMENVLLYIVSTTKPEYMKIQAFDIFDRENNAWTYSDNDNKGYKKWEEQRSYASRSMLLDAYEEAGVLPEGADISVVYREAEAQYMAVVKSVDFPASYMISPVGVFDFSFINNEALNVYRTNLGELYTEKDLLAPTASYTEKYYANDYAAEHNWFSAGLCNNSTDEFIDLLKKVYDKLPEDSDAAKTTMAFYNEAKTAKKYAPTEYEEVSAQIAAISAQITQGSVYDWQKAYAIQNYFDNGFTYDLGYRAPEELDTPEYFLNVSKTGTCSDFATAYCLLARASGLTVRYVEGFAMRSSSNGLYQIYTENAHAYPEVYIPGAGWMVFEPTVSGNAAAAAAEEEKEEETDYLAVFLTALVFFVAIVTLVLLIIFAPKINEAIFVFTVRIGKAEKGIIRLYGRFSKRAGLILGMNTVSMTCEQLEAEVSSHTGVSSEALTSVFTNVFYGGAPAESLDKTAALKCYKQQLKLLRSAVKKERKGRVK